MGQKTHPKGFRLVTTQSHLSNWYAGKKAYRSLIEEDSFIRDKIDNTFKDFLTLSKIEISRINGDEGTPEYVSITINALFPRAKEMYKKIGTYLNEEKSIETKSPFFNNLKGNLKVFTSLVLKRNIRNLIRLLQIKTKKNFYIGIKFIKNTFEDASLIAKFIGEQLRKRVPFRRVIKQIIKKVQISSMKGIKIEVSGRLNGIEIARSEWKRDGRIPLHTLRANIDYVSEYAETIYGLIGIKVWLFIN